MGTTPPTASITSPASPTLSPPSSIAIHFSEPVENFTLQDLQLTLTSTSGGAAASEPLEGAILTTTDTQNWTLGNLAGLTTASGTYVLTLVGLGSTVTDTFGNPLLTSASTSFTVDTTVPTVATPAIATPEIVTGTTTDLSVLGADTATGEGGLTYTWTATTLPNGAAMPTFSDNGSNAAKDTTATFSMAGTYGITVTITDPYGLSTSSSVSVTVNQTPTSIFNSGQPPTATATVFDQFGNPLANQPTFEPGSDTITNSLVFDSNVTLLPAAESTLTISGGISGKGGLTINAAGTVVLSGDNGYTGGTTVSAGTLVLSNSSAIAFNTSLTVGAGRGLHLRSIGHGGSSYSRGSCERPLASPANASRCVQRCIGRNLQHHEGNDRAGWHRRGFAEPAILDGTRGRNRRKSSVRAQRSVAGRSACDVAGSAISHCRRIGYASRGQARLVVNCPEGCWGPGLAGSGCNQLGQFGPAA